MAQDELRQTGSPSRRQSVQNWQRRVPQQRGIPQSHHDSSSIFNIATFDHCRKQAPTSFPTLKRRYPLIGSLTLHVGSQLNVGKVSTTVAESAHDVMITRLVPGV